MGPGAVLRARETQLQPKMLLQCLNAGSFLHGCPPTTRCPPAPSPVWCPQPPQLLGRCSGLQGMSPKMLLGPHPRSLAPKGGPGLCQSGMRSIRWSLQSFLAFGEGFLTQSEARNRGWGRKNLAPTKLCSLRHTKPGPSSAPGTLHFPRKRKHYLDGTGELEKRLSSCFFHQPL